MFDFSPLQVIVEIIPFGVDVPQNELPILYKVRRHGSGFEPRSAYIRDMQTGYETLTDAGVGDDCHPIHGSRCQVRIEGRAAPLPQRDAVRPGSVVDISIHEDAPQEPEFEGTEHTSLMQKTLQPRNVEWRYDNDPQCLGEEDTVAQQWLYPAGLCHDDGSCSSAQLRTTDELQEAIDLRSASRDEETDVPHTAGAPVDPLLIIEDWEDLRVMLREQPDEAPDEAAIVMYGLYQAHVGERRSTAHWDIHAVRECVFRTWDDILLPGVTAFLHLVRPQEYLHQCEIHVIVEFSSPMIPLPNFDKPSLRRTIWHSVGADNPIVVAAYHTPGSNRFELLRGTGLSEWCGPDSRMTCNLYIEKALLLPLALARIQSGSLVEVYVHDILDSDAISTLQVGHVEAQGRAQVRLYDTARDEGCVAAQWAGEHDVKRLETGGEGAEVNSASGTLNPWSPDTPGIMWRPNPTLVEDFDAVVPFRHRTTDGHIAFGRTIPPPNWERNPFLRSAAGSGAAYRDDDGELRVLIRTWIASTHSTLILPHRDVTLRGQLMHELENRIRRAWTDQIAPTDQLRLTTVRPTPNVGYQGQRPLHVLIELNRPRHSQLHPILIAHREIDHNGPSPHIEWIPVLVATPAGVTTLHRICSPPCGAGQMLIPQPGRIRRWLQQDQGRPVFPGLFLPVWWDLRLQQQQGPAYGHEERPDDGDDIALLQRHFIVQEEGGTVSANYGTSTSEPRDVSLDSLSTHVIDRWCDSLSSCDVQEDTSKARITQARPNGAITPDPDGQVPYQYRSHNGARIPGTIIPPPNWNRLSGLRYADNRGAVIRDVTGQLRVHIRSWLLPHDRFGPMYWKECTIPAQLYLRLLDRLKSVWRPELLEGDRLRARIVQPTPAPPVGDQARLHILLECNRPYDSTRRAILLSFQELNADGPSPDKTWIPYLAPQVITPQIIAGMLPAQCDPRHLIVPAGTPDRRWLTEHEERAVDDGLYLPTLRDVRRGVSTQRIEIDEATLMQTGLPANTGDADDATDSLQLMQRTGSRTPRRDLTTPSSVSSSLSPVLAHVFHLSSEHRLITFDRAAPLSFFQQLDRLWKRPAHAHSIALHEVKTPPSDLETSGDVTFLFEQAPDRNRQAAATDQLILLDVEIYSQGETTPGKHIRRVLWSRRLINRQTMLSLTASVSLCEVPGNHLPVEHQQPYMARRRHC